MKKTDADVGILGEVAEAPVAALGIQMAQVGFRQLLFSHHGKTVRDIICALRDNLLTAGGYSNEMIAEQTVVSVLNFNVHLNRTVMGKRYVERVTEIIPHVDEPYAAAMDDATKQYYYRKTDRQTFDQRDIMVFENDQFVFKNEISEDNVNAIKYFLTDEEQQRFELFLVRMKDAVAVYSSDSHSINNITTVASA